MRNLLLFTALLAAVAALRLAGLGLHGLGLDEAWDLMVFALPPAEIIALLRQPPAGVLWPPPLHYLLQHALSAAAGDPLMAARAASAFWSLAALALWFAPDLAAWWTSLSIGAKALLGGGVSLGGTLLVGMASLPEGSLAPTSAGGTTPMASPKAEQTAEKDAI